jgi:hypothetical protein
MIRKQNNTFIDKRTKAKFVKIVIWWSSETTIKNEA